MGRLKFYLLPVTALVLLVSIALLGQLQPPKPNSVDITGTLTSAQILALNTTPIAAIPAQGAGTVIIVDQFAAELVYNSVAYVSAGALGAHYGTTTGQSATNTSCSAAQMTATANAICFGSPVSNGNVAASTALNLAVVLAVSTSNPTTGNSTVNYWIKYHVLNGL